jgi:hypothetical protein
LCIPVQFQYYKYEKEKVQPARRIFFVRERGEVHIGGPTFYRGNEPLGQAPSLFVPFTGRSKPLFFKPIEERQPAGQIGTPCPVLSLFYLHRLRLQDKYSFHWSPMVMQLLQRLGANHDKRPVGFYKRFRRVKEPRHTSGNLCLNAGKTLRKQGNRQSG